MLDTLKMSFTVSPASKAPLLLPPSESFIRTKAICGFGAFMVIEHSPLLVSRLSPDMLYDIGITAWSSMPSRTEKVNASSFVVVLFAAMSPNDSLLSLIVTSLLVEEIAKLTLLAVSTPTLFKV